jgi:hypothetical protein
MSLCTVESLLQTPCAKSIRGGSVEDPGESERIPRSGLANLADRMAEDAHLMRAAHCHHRDRSRGEGTRTARKHPPARTDTHTPALPAFVDYRGVTSDIEKMTRRFISKEKADEIGRKMRQVLGSRS